MSYPDYSKVLWDASGKPYWQNSDGTKTYISPMAAAAYGNPTDPSYDPKLAAWAHSMGAVINYGAPDPNGTPTATVQSTGTPQGGLFTNRGTWNSQTGAWDQGVNWGNVLSMVAAGVITAGVADEIMGAAPGTAQGYMAAGVGPDGTPITAASAGSVTDLGPISSATLPGATSVAPAAGSVTDLGPVSGATLPGAAANPTPYSMTAAAAQSPDTGTVMGDGLTSGGTGAVGAASPVVKAISTLAGLFGGKFIGSLTNSTPPQLSTLLNLATQQAQQKAPLNQAATQGQYGLLPNFARVGTSMPNMPINGQGQLTGSV